MTSTEILMYNDDYDDDDGDHYITMTLTLMLTGRAKPEDVDPRTVYPWKDSIFCRCCSQSARHKCLCGYDDCGANITPASDGGGDSPTKTEV